MKKCLFVGDYYGERCESTIRSLSTSQSPFSSLRFNRKIVEGLQQNDISTIVLSAPYIDSWPGCKNVYFKSKKESDNTHIVGYFNVPPFKNLSRYRNLKKELNYILDDDNFDFVFISEAHLPFIKLIDPIKKRNANCKIVLCVMDLPELMYLGDEKRRIYSFFKRIETRKIIRLCKKIDIFYLLSPYMAESKIVDTYKKLFVRETIINDNDKPAIDLRKKREKPTIVYSGTLSKRFGIESLLSAFVSRKVDYELLIAGCGECQQEIIDLADKDDDLKFFGLLTGERYKSFLRNADFFVNPRNDDDLFSRYSFPSKIGEYCEYNKPIISFDMNILNEDFRSAMYVARDGSTLGLAEVIDKAVSSSEEEYLSKCCNVKKLSLKYCKKKIIEDLVTLL